MLILYITSARNSYSAHLEQGHSEEYLQLIKDRFSFAVSDSLRDFHASYDYSAGALYGEPSLLHSFQQLHTDLSSFDDHVSSIFNLMAYLFRHDSSDTFLPDGFVPYTSLQLFQKYARKLHQLGYNRSETYAWVQRLDAHPNRALVLRSLENMPNLSSKAEVEQPFVLHSSQSTHLYIIELKHQHQLLAQHHPVEVFNKFLHVFSTLINSALEPHDSTFFYSSGEIHCSHSSIPHHVLYTLISQANSLALRLFSTFILPGLPIAESQLSFSVTRVFVNYSEELLRLGYKVKDLLHISQQIVTSSRRDYLLFSLHSQKFPSREDLESVIDASAPSRSQLLEVFHA